VTDTTTLDVAAPTSEKPRRSGALTAMRLAELQGLASSMGISGTAKMRKGDLIDVIRAKQSGAPVAPSSSAGTTERPATGNRRVVRGVRGEGAPQAERLEGAAERETISREDSASREQDRAETRSDGRDAESRRDAQTRRDAADRQGEDRQSERRSQGSRRQGEHSQSGEDGRTGEGEPVDGGRREQAYRNREQYRDRGEQRGQQDQQGRDGQARQSDVREQNQRGQQDTQQRDGQGRQSDGQPNRDGQSRDQQGRQGAQQGQQNQGQQGRYDDEDGPGSRRRGRNRGRNRDKRRMPGQPAGGDFDAEPQVADDDVLTPCAGILDILDNYAFVRTSGYLPGPNDVYVPLGMVKRHGLRKGDAVTGAVKTPRDGEEAQTVQAGSRNQRQKYNPLVRLDTVNGMTPDAAHHRPEFGKLTPLYPQERLRLETEPNQLSTRIIDLVAPIGKGQRGLIVSPPKAGKTLILQAIANAITTNNPEAHLMVVLVDERPEEVTDMQRTVKGEVIASTFDRPADDHTTVAELAIERAKRLVEMGHDVVVLLDSITRLGRAYNLAAPASGRILSGGVDSSALYPPKRFFGAARNIENGGSLTILATTLVETGSKMDEVIFEEFKGTGNMELRLSRQLADRRIFPAVDVNPSGTRREEILLAPEELKIMWKLRRVMSALDAQQAVELLIDRLKKTKSNYEFLVQVQQTSSIRLDDEKD